VGPVTNTTPRSDARGRIEETDDDLLAVPCDRDARNAQIPHLAVHAGRRAAIVRMERIGHVELRDDLRPPDDRPSRRARYPHHLAQDAIHPVPDQQPLVERPEVHVAGALAHRVGDSRVHELRDRRLDCGAGVVDLDLLHCRLDDSRRAEAAHEPLD